MQDQILIDHTHAPDVTSAHRRPYRGPARLLSRTAFRYPGIRIAIQISAAVVLFCAADLLLPWSSLTALPSKWHPLLAWSLACSFVAAIDLQLFSRPLKVYEQALTMELLGGYEEALRTLEDIGPDRNALITLPRDMYHEFRAKAFLHSGRSAEADKELKEAALHGLPSTQLDYLRCETFSSEKALYEMPAVSASLKFEQALSRLSETTERHETKRLLQEVLALPPELHPSGAFTDRLARAFLHCIRLWTGEADDALPKISSELFRLHSGAVVIETLRPYTALLYAERARYFARHRDAFRARQDLRAALKFCRYPAVMRTVREVKELLKG